MKEISQFEIRRIAKGFVDAYLQDGTEAAGKYGVENIIDPVTATDEELAFWQAEIEKEFRRQGYTLTKDEDGKVEAEGVGY